MSEHIGISGNIQRGLLLKEQGRYADAERYFREALAENPRDAFAFHQLAGCQLQMDGQERAALETINHALAIEPDDADHHVLKSFILSALDRPHEALKSARAALELNPYSDYAFTAEAQALMQMQVWAGAEKAARQALAIDADNALAANQLAQALRLQNKMSENAAQIAGMLARDPEDAMTHCNAGWAALQRGQRRVAEEHFKEALRLDPDFEAAREGLLNSFRARSPLYRAYLAYCFWMARLSKRMRWGVVLGLYFGVKFARVLFTGSFAPVGALIGLLYAIFVLWVWVARGVGNFILLFDSFAKYALRKNEKIEAWFVGGGLLVGIVVLASSFLVSSFSGFASGAMLIASIALIAAAFPFSMTFTNGSKIGRWLFGGVAATVLLGATMYVGGKLAGSTSIDDAGLQLFTIGLFGCLASTWLGNIPALRRHTD